MYETVEAEIKGKVMLLQICEDEKAREVEVVEIHDSFVIVRYMMGALRYTDIVPWARIQFMRIKEIKE